MVIDHVSQRIKKWKSLYKNIQEFIPISNTQKIGIDDLKRSLVDIAVNKKLVGHPVPVSYVQLKEQINNMSHPPGKDKKGIALMPW